MAYEQPSEQPQTQRQGGSRGRRLSAVFCEPFGRSVSASNHGMHWLGCNHQHHLSLLLQPTQKCSKVCVVWEVTSAMHGYVCTPTRLLHRHNTITTPKNGMGVTHSGPTRNNCHRAPSNPGPAPQVAKAVFHHQPLSFPPECHSTPLQPEEQHNCETLMVQTLERAGSACLVFDIREFQHAKLPDSVASRWGLKLRSSKHPRAIRTAHRTNSAQEVRSIYFVRPLGCSAVPLFGCALLPANAAIGCRALRSPRCYPRRYKTLTKTCFTRCHLSGR